MKAPENHEITERFTELSTALASGEIPKHTARQELDNTISQWALRGNFMIGFRQGRLDYTIFDPTKEDRFTWEQSINDWDSWEYP